MRIDELSEGYTNIEIRDSYVVLTLNNGRDFFEPDKVLGSKRRLEKTQEKFRKELEIILGIIDDIKIKDS